MKYYFLMILFVLNSTILGIQAILGKEWSQFKLVNNKLYGTEEEENLRFNIWRSNTKLIQEHNRKFEQGLVSYSLNMNKFGDMVSFG